MATVEERVQKGIDFLDASQSVPDNWRELLDLKTLDIENCKRCVLGQLLGDFIRWFSLSDMPGNPCDFGFDIYPDDNFELDDEFSILQDEWFKRLNNG